MTGVNTIKKYLTLRNAAIAVAAFLAVVGLQHQLSIHRTLARMADDPMGAVLGPASSRNTIVEFMDYRCSGCRVFSTGTLPAFMQKHPDVRIVIRHDPIYGDPSVHEAQLALAAARQGKFKVMHDILVARADPLPTAEIPALAQQLGLDVARLESDAKDPAILHHLGETVLATDLLRIPSAPAFIINGTVYIPGPGPVPDLARFEATYARLAR